MPASNESEKRFAKCSLENLAPELLLPNLISLDCLIRELPAAFRLFEEYGVEITDAVLSSGLTHRHIQVIIRVAALIRSSTLPINTLPDFQNLVTHEAMYHRLQKSPTGLAPRRLSENTQPAVLRSILATNRQITEHAFRCLAHFLERFKPIRPKHLVNTGGCTFPSSFELYLPDGQLGTNFRWYKVISDLRVAAAHMMLMWPEKDIQRLNNEETVLLFYGERLFPRNCSEDVMHEIHPEFDELSSVVDYIQVTREATVSPFQDTRQDWLGYGHLQAERIWHQPLPGRKDCPHGSYTPFIFTEFERYRRLGFAFWDYERLWNYGLKAPPKNKPKNRDHFYYFAWQSILTDEELGEIEKKRKIRAAEFVPRS